MTDLLDVEFPWCRRCGIREVRFEEDDFCVECTQKIIGPKPAKQKLPCPGCGLPVLFDHDIEDLDDEDRLCDACYERWERHQENEPVSSLFEWWDALWELTFDEIIALKRQEIAYLAQELINALEE